MAKLGLFGPVVGALTNIPTSVQFTLSSKTSLGGYFGTIGKVPNAAFNAILNTAPITSSPVLVGVALAGGVTGTAYSESLVVVNGLSPFTFSLVSGTLPIGTTLNSSTGAISGTPTTTGTYSFTIRVVDSLGSSATQSFSIAVASPSSGSGGGGAYVFVT